MRRRIFLNLVVVAAVLLFTPLGERPLAFLLPVGDVATIDFATLALTDKPNQHLLCPADFCAAEAQEVSPLVDLPLDELRTRWDAVIAAQERVTVLAESNGQIDYVQRTAIVRYPDIITVRFIALTPSQSTLAIYSRSIFGTSDFGGNRGRVDAWLAALEGQTP